MMFEVTVVINYVKSDFLFLLRSFCTIRSKIPFIPKGVRYYEDNFFRYLE